MPEAEAIAVLKRCIRPAGLQASGYESGHRQVWARDSMIALLGARFAKDAEIDTALRASIMLLRSRQAPNGAIPNNVDSTSLRANFRASSDAGLWWIIGSSIVEPDPATAESVLRWYECQDTDQAGLIGMHEASDWEDLLCTRGKGLYVNCLYVMALRAAGQREKAKDVSRRINEVLWYKGDGDLLSRFTHTFSTENLGHVDSLGRTRHLPAKKYLQRERYYLPYVAFRAAGEWFDTLGNILAILSGVADETKTALILDLIERECVTNAVPRSLAPAIQPGDTDWRDYYGTLNAPHCHHNGGVWPFIAGFLVAAQIRAGRYATAQKTFEALTELNRAGEFNEWHQGLTLEPLGVRSQAWSAGMYLFAAECLKHRAVPDAWFGIRD